MYHWLLGSYTSYRPAQSEDKRDTKHRDRWNATQCTHLIGCSDIANSNIDLNACLISSSRSSCVSLSFIITVNSEKSSLPLWSTSISFMMFIISSSVGLRPSVRISTPNSFALMKPSPFWNKIKDRFFLFTGGEKTSLHVLLSNSQGEPGRNFSQQRTNLFSWLCNCE